MGPLAYRTMLADIERPDDFQRRARVASCPVGDFVFGGFAAGPKTLGLRTGGTESPFWKARVDKARLDSETHSHRTAVLAGDVECWICIAGIWITAVVQHVVDQVAVLKTSTGDRHVVPVNEIAFERPCRWPV